MRIVGTNLPEDAWFNPVAVATTGANIALSGSQTIDGVLVGQFTTGDPRVQRVLAKDQSDATTVGIYDATSDTIPWARSKDANDQTQWSQGVQVLVNGGTVNSGTAWKVTTAGTNGQIIPGKTQIAFAASFYAPVPAALQKPASAATINIASTWVEVGIDTRSTSVTVNLPSVATWTAINPGRSLKILDYYGNAFSNNVTPVPSGTDIFQWGGVTPKILSNFGILRLRPDASASPAAWLVCQAD